MIICVDFDGTIVTHSFPKIGSDIGAFPWLQRWQEAGAKLVLWTMRSDGQEAGNVLTEAVEYCKKKGVEFWAVNNNPEQASWTTSPKVYAHLYIDDAAYGCPLVRPATSRPWVDWQQVGPAVLKTIQENK